MSAVLLVALTLAAQDSPFLRCAALRDDAERLACYDRTAAVLTAAPGAELSGMDAPAEAAPPAPGTAPRAALLPSPAPAAAPTETAEGRRRFGLPQRRQEPESVSTAVAALELDRAGKLVVTLADGQVWRQLSGDTTDVRLPREVATQTATIRRAALGSYRLRLEPLGRTVRVKRVE